MHANTPECLDYTAVHFQEALQGAITEGRAVLERCLPICRAWGQADRQVVESIERLLAQSK